VEKGGLDRHDTWLRANVVFGSAIAFVESFIDLGNPLLNTRRNDGLPGPLERQTAPELRCGTLKNTAGETWNRLLNFFM